MNLMTAPKGPLTALVSGDSNIPCIIPPSTDVSLRAGRGARSVRIFSPHGQLDMDTLRRFAYRSRQKPRVYHAWLLMSVDVTHVKTGEKKLHGCAGKHSGADRQIGPPCLSG